MYNDLLNECENLGLTVTETKFPDTIKGFHGLTLDNNIYINNKLSSREKYVTLAEEMMHAKYSVGNILDQKDIRNKKDEVGVRRRSYEKLLPLSKIIELYKKNIADIESMEEYLDLDHNVIVKILEYYQVKYGVSYKYDDNYIIYFYPNLGVLELF